MAPQKTAEQLQAELDQLKAENQKLRDMKTPVKSLTCKVSEKGAVSVYGLGRFPVTLYKTQWDKLFLEQAMIRAFIKAHEGQLATKD